VLAFAGAGWGAAFLPQMLEAEAQMRKVAIPASDPVTGWGGSLVK